MVICASQSIMDHSGGIEDILMKEEQCVCTLSGNVLLGTLPCHKLFNMYIRQSTLELLSLLVKENQKGTVF